MEKQIMKKLNKKQRLAILKIDKTSSACFSDLLYSDSLYQRLISLLDDNVNEYREAFQTTVSDNLDEASESDLQQNEYAEINQSLSKYKEAMTEIHHAQGIPDGLQLFQNMSMKELKELSAKEKLKTPKPVVNNDKMPYEKMERIADKAATEIITSLKGLCVGDDSASILKSAIIISLFKEEYIVD